ncbi:MAG: hypothetical protein R2744_07545 [Bacteroidales bacterium]
MQGIIGMNPVKTKIGKNIYPENKWIPYPPAPKRGLELVCENL